MTKCVATAVTRNNESFRMSGDTIWSIDTSSGLTNQFSTSRGLRTPHEKSDGILFAGQNRSDAPGARPRRRSSACGARLDIRLRPWVFRPGIALLPMGFCCATSPVVAGAIRTREWPLSRVFVGFNGQYVRSGHYVRCAIFLLGSRTVGGRPTASNAARETRSDPQRLLDDTPHLPNQKLTRVHGVTICRELMHADQINKSEHSETDRRLSLFS